MGSDDDEEEEAAAAAAERNSKIHVNKGAPDGMPMQAVKMTTKTPEGRMAFEFEGRTIYEWEQSLQECNIYIRPPDGVTKKLIDIEISYNHLKVGLKGADPFIDEDIFSTIKTDESYWMFSDGEININLQKMKKGEVRAPDINVISNLNLIFFLIPRPGIFRWWVAQARQ